MTSKTKDSSDNTPAYLKWILCGFMFVFVASIIVYAVLTENRYTSISISEANRLIKDCKVAKVYEVGSPSHRRPNRVRTLIELKEGTSMQTEYGTHLTVFREAIDSVDCPLYSKSLEIK